MMDDRARIPFALLGVLLLVSSATLSTTMRPARPPTDSETEVVVERTTATTQTALREAVSTASTEAGANPVVEPANTTAGRVLNDSSAFRDALRLRIYLAARERLAGVTVRRGDVTGRVSLPTTETETELRAAKRRVAIERVDSNGTAIRTTIENVTLRTRENGAVTSRTTISPTVVVATPVLAAHDRVEAYQERLDAGITERGLSQRLTAQLYALAWSRGYLQYSGTPITNVVSNQHVGVIANQALLALQRETIGHSDPRGRRTLAVAAMRTTARDLTVATGHDNRITDALLGGPTGPADSDIQGLEPPQRSGPDEQRRIGINDTAERAFVDLLDNGTIEDTIESAYSVEFRTVGRVEGDRQLDPVAPSSPDGNWTQIEQERNRTGWHRNVSVDPPAVPGGWHTFETYSRQTVITVQITRTWQRTVEGENGTETERQTTSRTTTTRENVSVAVIGRHDDTSPAPNRPISPVHERGVGPLDGPNLAGARQAAITVMIDNRGGRTAVLEAAARDDLDREIITWPLADRPTNVTQWVYRDLMTLRERVRDEQIPVEQGALGSFAVNPSAALADTLQQRRAELLDAPATYDSAATKARIAVRAAYLDRVETRLRERAADRRDQRGAFRETLDEQGTSLERLQESLAARERPSPAQQPRISGVGGTLRLTTDAAPAYLTQSELTHDQVPAIDGRSHPMVARNVNVFSVPYQTVSDTVVDEVFGTNSRAPLSVAANTLNATNATLAQVNHSETFQYQSQMNIPEEELERNRRAGDVLELQHRRDTLQTTVSDANVNLLDGQRTVLAGQNVGENFTMRAVMLQRAIAPWNTTHGRALALANGSVDRRLVVIASRRANLSAAERDRLALRLNESRRQLLADNSTRPPVDRVNESRSMAHRVVRGLGREVAPRVAERGTQRAYRRLVGRSFKSLPSGVPLAPVPGYWYATMNVWQVSIQGEYARFGVRVSQGRPTTPGSEFVYARDGDDVTLDVDGDGDTERLGRSTRVDFEASATVLVVVPPGSTGVGDTNGVTIEASDGWPRPGPE